MDTLQWSLPDPCTACSYTSEKEDREKLDKYREFFQLLTEMETTEIDDKVYNYLSAWCAGLMEEVFHDRSDLKITFQTNKNPNNRDILYIRTCHYVHTICMEHWLWQAAILYGEIVLPAFTQYYGENSKVVAALLVRWVECTKYKAVSVLATDLENRDSKQ